MTGFEDTIFMISKNDYIVNHWYTVAWLTIATVYVYQAVISDIIGFFRVKKKEEQTPSSSGDTTGGND